MTPSDLPVDAVAQALKMAPAALSLDELLAALPDLNGYKVCEALRELVKTRVADFDYRPEASTLSKLVFQPGKAFAGYAWAHSPVSDALNLILLHVSQQSDGRGDPMGSFTMDYLHQKLGTKLSDEVLTQAVRAGLDERIFALFSNPTNKYVAFSQLERHQFTVVGTDDKVHQALCFHVRAGNADVAIDKVRQSAFGNEELALQGVTTGTVRFAAVAGHASFMEVVL